MSGSSQNGKPVRIDGIPIFQDNMIAA